MSQFMKVTIVEDEKKTPIFLNLDKITALGTTEKDGKSLTRIIVDKDLNIAVEEPITAFFQPPPAPKQEPSEPVGIKPA